MSQKLVLLFWIPTCLFLLTGCITNKNPEAPYSDKYLNTQANLGSEELAALSGIWQQALNHIHAAESIARSSLLEAKQKLDFMLKELHSARIAIPESLTTETEFQAEERVSSLEMNDFPGFEKALASSQQESDTLKGSLREIRQKQELHQKEMAAEQRQRTEKIQALLAAKDQQIDQLKQDLKDNTQKLVINTLIGISSITILGSIGLIAFSIYAGGLGGKSIAAGVIGIICGLGLLGSVRILGHPWLPYALGAVILFLVLLAFVLWFLDWWKGNQEYLLGIQTIGGVEEWKNHLKTLSGSEENKKALDSYEDINIGLKTFLKEWNHDVKLRPTLDRLLMRLNQL